MGREGYSRHPETLRWVGRLKALYRRHEALVVEMTRRGYNHGTPLDRRKATGKTRQDRLIDSLPAQRARLRAKGCDCRV